METLSQIGNQTWDDLIFSRRNKKYGAYIHRKLQDRNMIIGFLISSIPLLVLAIFSAIQEVELSPIVMDKPPIMLDPIKDKIIPIEIEKGNTASSSSKKESKVPDENKALVPVDELKSETKVVDKEIPEDEKEIDSNQAFGAKDESETTDSGMDDNIGNGINNGNIGSNGNDQVIDFDTFYLDVIKPEFAGGEKAMIKYLQRNIKSPKNQNVQDNLVKVIFIVGDDGSIVEAKIIKSAGSEFDEEALRVVKNMPKWVPGTHAGKPAKFRLILPIRFMQRN